MSESDPIPDDERVPEADEYGYIEFAFSDEEKEALYELTTEEESDILS